MKAAKIFLFLIIGIVVFAGVLWFFQRETTSQETIKVYKSTLVSNPCEVQLPTGIPSETDSQTHAQGKLHSHSHERPSDSMIQIFSENIGNTTDPKLLRWLAYLKSEEGRAFFDSFPSPDEWFEKSQSFGFFVNTPERQASTDRWFRQHFPMGTADENEHVIRDIMRDAILEHEHHKEAEYSRSRNADVLHQILEGDKFLAEHARAMSVLWPTKENIDYYRGLRALQENGWHVDPQ